MSLTHTLQMCGSSNNARQQRARIRELSWSKFRCTGLPQECLQCFSHPPRRGIICFDDMS